MPTQRRVELAGSHRETATGATPDRPIDNQEMVQATIILRRRERATMPPPETFAYRQANTRTYHSRDDFAALHGADHQDMAAIEAFAHEYGLTIAQCSAARRTVVVTGTAANIQAAVGIHHGCATGNIQRDAIPSPRSISDISAIRNIDHAGARAASQKARVSGAGLKATAQGHRAVCPKRKVPAA